MQAVRQSSGVDQGQDECQMQGLEIHNEGVKPVSMFVVSDLGDYCILHKSGSFITELNTLF